MAPGGSGLSVGIISTLRRFEAVGSLEMYGPDFELLFVVVIKLFGNGNRLLLDLYVLARIGEFPVCCNRIRGCGNGLLRESQVRDLPIVLRDDDIAAVHKAPSSGKQLLRE